MNYMYGGPIGRDKITREIAYIKKTIYLKGFNCPYLSIAYFIHAGFGNPVNLFAPLTEVETRILDYQLESKKDGICKYKLCSKHPLENK